MKDFVTMKMLGLAVTFIIGPLTYLAVRHIKKFWLWLNRQPRTAQQAFVLVIAFALTAGAQALGLTLPGECAAVGTGVLTDECQSALANPTLVKSALAGVVAMLMHALKKSDPNT